MMFSILIPVYNTQKYLRQCLDSVLSQDYENYEVILVNDGSTDDSGLICEEYEKKDSRIKYFYKNNEGLLLTRRYSIQKANGDYILFLDSDDYWKPNLLSKISEKIKSTNADMILFRYCCIRDNGEFIYNDTGIFPDGTLFREEDKNKFIEQFVSSYRLNTLWSKCVKKTIVDKEADYSIFRDKKGEDALQSVALIKNAKSIYYIDDVLYCYRQSENGRSRNFKYKYFKDLEMVNKHVFDVLEVQNMEEKVKIKLCAKYLTGFLSYMYPYVNLCKSFKEFYGGISEVKKFEFLQQSFKYVTKENLQNLNTKNDYTLFINNNYKIIYVKYKIKGFLRKFIGK